MFSPPLPHAGKGRLPAACLRAIRPHRQPPPAQAGEREPSRQFARLLFPYILPGEILVGTPMRRPIVERTMSLDAG